MPYYDGSWHMFSQHERREFGRKQRAAARQKWHAKWISKQTLKSERLWTDKAIHQFLGQPGDAGPIKAWLRKDVLAAEEKEDFKAWMQKRRVEVASMETRRVILRVSQK